MKNRLSVLVSAMALSMAAGASAYKVYSIPSYPIRPSTPWITQGVDVIKHRPSTKGRKKAKNVILFVADGMVVSTVTAARILEAQLKGMSGEENMLSFDLFPYTAMSKTYNIDAQSPYSAGTMTAMMTGVKTDIGVIGVDEQDKRARVAALYGSGCR